MSPAKRKVAVTGSAGFIGRSVVRELTELGHEVVPIDRAHGCDILNPECLHDVLNGCHSVIHLAGVLGTAELLDSVDQAIDVNVRGTLRVVEAAHGAGVAYVGITMPDCWPSVYQATKLAAQRIAEAFHNARGLPVTHIRAFNAYGPGQAYGPGHPQKILPTFARCAWEGRPFPIWGDGTQTVDLVHVDHIAHCLVHAAAAENTYGAYGHAETWDAGTAVEMSVGRVADLVADVVGAHPGFNYLPMRAGEIEHTFLAAKRFGPVGREYFSHFRFYEAVVSYK